MLINITTRMWKQERGIKEDRQQQQQLRLTLGMIRQVWVCTYCRRKMHHTTQ